MSNLADNELNNQLQKLQAYVSSDNKTMETELEAAAKHLPAYLKIVKGHIEQLREVLKLENHNNRTLETAGLAAPVQQLIKLFGSLRDDDIQLLEDLAHSARTWQPESSEQIANNSSEVYEETT